MIHKILLNPHNPIYLDKRTGLLFSVTMMSQAAIEAIIEKTVAQRVQQQLRSLRLPISTRVRHQQLNAVGTPISPQDTPTVPPAQAGGNLFRSQSQSSLDGDEMAPQTPQAQHLRRSLSSTSSASIAASSQSTACSTPRSEELDEENYASCYNEISPVFKVSKKKLYKECDKEVVRNPIMTLLDPLLLAPFKSPLFRRFAKASDPSSLKQNPDICFEDFKERIRDTIRTLCAKTNSTEPFLDQRYFWCAYDLVRKRRANHVQSWRNKGRPSNFTYGGRDIYEATYGPIEPNPPHQFLSRKKRKTKKQLFAAPAPTPAPTRPPFPTSPDAPPEILRHSPDVLSDTDEDTMDYVEESQVPVDESPLPEFDPFEDADLLEFAHKRCEKCNRLFDWNNSFCPDDAPPKLCPRCERIQTVCKCLDCGKTLTAGTAFPKGNMHWAGSDVKKNWCGVCYAKMLRDKVLPEYNARLHEQQQQQQQVKRKRTLGGEAQPPKKKQKTPCKKCGALTHKTARSRLCPYNKKYLDLETNNVRVTPPIRHRKFGGKAPRNVAVTTNNNNNVPMAVITEPVVAGANPPPQPGVVNPPPQPDVAGANPPPQPDVVNPPPPPRRIVPQLAYAVGVNVLAKFNRRHYALAHVIKRTGTHYDVYFPDDGKVKRGVPPCDLRHCPNSYAAPKRSEMLGETFEYEGDEDIPEGTVWRVRQIVNGEHGVPEYRCAKIEGGGRMNVANFDVGFVMRTIKKQFEKEREIGPKR